MKRPFFRQEAVKYSMSSGDAGESFAAGVPPAWSVTALIIAFCVGSLVVFSVLVSFPRSEAVRGALRYTGAESKLLAETNGYVSAVFVKNGHSISQGEPILEISTERFLSTTTELNQTAIDLLEDERIGLQEQKAAIKASAELEITNVELDTRSALRRVTELEAELHLTLNRLASAKQRASDAQEFLDEGLIAEQQLFEREELVSQLEQARLRLVAQISDASSTEGVNAVEIARIRARLRSSEAEVEQRINKIDSQIAAATARKSYIVKAPNSGEMTLLTLKEGEAVSPNQLLGVILPVGSTLFAQIYVPSRAIGLIEEGQIVRIQFDAFPYQKYGVSEGQIASISAISLQPADAGLASRTQEPVYRISVELHDQKLIAHGAEHKLQAGMELSAEIILEERKLYEWFLEPFQR